MAKFDPEKINASVGHPKANDVLRARVAKGGSSTWTKNRDICKALEIDETEYRKIVYNRNFRGYYPQLRRELAVKQELAQELSKQFAGQLAEQIV